jgi:hypothetical protein
MKQCPLFATAALSAALLSAFASNKAELELEMATEKSKLGIAYELRQIERQT